MISGTPCTCEKHGRPKTECPVGSSCWDSGTYDNSGCKTEAAPSKCSTATCTGGKTTKTGYCPNGDCSEANCCEYPACTSDGVISGTPCTCAKHGRPKTECPVGSSCWDSGTYDNSGCKAEAAPSTRCDTIHSQCTAAGKNPTSGYCEQGGCTVESCCKNPSCNGDGTTAADQVCECGWGSDVIKACAAGNYCWEESGAKCTPNSKDSYPSQRCSAGFGGWQGNADTCPPNFEKRDLGPGSEKDDGHQGKMMDYTTCCRAKCKDLYDNCNDVDSSIQLLANHHVYPSRDGTYSQQECCRVSQCKQWSNDGGNCPADKSVRGDEDFHMCSEGSCDADDCCQDNHGGDDGGDDESQECMDAKAITHVNEYGDKDAGIYTGQCYDVNMNGDNDDKTKWTFKKGTGSCAVCKDALAIRFGPTCEGKNSAGKQAYPSGASQLQTIGDDANVCCFSYPGGSCGANSWSSSDDGTAKCTGANSADSDCTHCQGIIDAYKDCPKTDKEKCEDAEAITHKNYQGDKDAGPHVAQCFNISTNGEEDVTKWIFEKGTGSCAVCKDAVQLRFGSTCEGAPGKDCKHCQGIIDAYKDCPTTAAVVAPAPAPKTGVEEDSNSKTVTPSSGEEVEEFIFDDTLSAADDQHGWRLTSIVIFSVSVVLHALV